MDWLALRTKRTKADIPSVLIVDDDERIRDFLQRTLTAFDYKVLIADDAETAVRLLARRPHVALCDVHLPGANGLWLADQIRVSSPTTAIILATGDQRVPPTESLRPHVTAYLVKPFSAELLRDAIEAGVQWSEGQRRRA